MRRRRRDAADGRRLRGDDGTALLEFAVVAPVFFLLIFGIIEFGLIYRDYLTVQDAVNDGARSAGIQGPNLGVIDDDPPPAMGSPPLLPTATADFATIKRIRQGMGLIPVEWIERIVIFHAQDPTFGSASAQLSAACKDGTGTSGTGPSANPSQNYIGACNVYDAEEAFRAYEAKDVAYFSCALNGSSRECDWPGRDRVNDPVNPTVANNIGPDYLGVYIEIARPYVTGIFGQEFTFSQTVIVRLEPGLVTT